MSAAEPIRVIAQVDPCEHPGIRLGVMMLVRSVEMSRGKGALKVALMFADPATPPQALPPADVHILSLLPELAQRARARADAFAAWRDRLAAAQARARIVFLCTIFRHVRDRGRTGEADATLVHIRQLNLLAIELSHALGVRIVDIDRALAYFGARALATDYRLSGEAAAGFVGHAFATAVLAGGLDEAIDPMVQESARTYLGGLDNIPALLRAMALPHG